VIDEHIAQLVDLMNREQLIWTTGSCQGHGHLFLVVSPYVAFKSSIAIASKIATALRDDYYSSAPKLNYFWELSACFDAKSELTYVLTVPGISSGKLTNATRYGVDQDFELVGQMTQEILDHFESENIEVESEKNSTDKNKPCE
jgi:hypothetical protein